MPVVGADDVILLGAPLSLSGKYAREGLHVRNGYDFAIRKINDKGGVKVGGRRHKLALRYYDDASAPIRATELAERLIKQDGVKFMLGPYGSGQTKAVLPVIERHKVPLVQGNGEARELFARGSRYHFAVLSTSDQYLTPVIEFAAGHAGKLGKTKESLRIALAMADEQFAQDVRAGLLDLIMRQGMNVVVDDQLPPELDDMSFTLKRVKALKPDLLLISGREQGALTAVTQIRELRIDVPVIAMTHCKTAGIAEKHGMAAEYVLCTHQWHRSLPHKDELFGTAEDFAQEFERTHNYEAPDEAAQAAASVQVFADAIGRAQSLDAETVREAISATELQTFYGPIKFDAAGRNIAKSMVLTQIQNGKHVPVSPTPSAAGTPFAPRSLD